jgi:hypothetical protein
VGMVVSYLDSLSASVNIRLRSRCATQLSVQTLDSTALPTATVIDAARCLRISFEYLLKP